MIELILILVRQEVVKQIVQEQHRLLEDIVEMESKKIFHKQKPPYLDTLPEEIIASLSGQFAAMGACLTVGTPLTTGNTTSIWCNASPAHCATAPLHGPARGVGQPATRTDTPQWWRPHHGRCAGAGAGSRLDAVLVAVELVLEHATPSGHISVEHILNVCPIQQSRSAPPPHPQS